MTAWLESGAGRAAADGKAAYAYLADTVMAEFAWAADVDKAAAVAALLTCTNRPAMRIAPGFIFNAASAASGKTVLAETVAAAALGQRPSLLSWPTNDDELAKTVLAALRQGGRVLLFDNAPNGAVVDQPEIAKLVTTGTYLGRVLGQSTVVELPAPAAFLGTGNNLRIESDLTSRLIEIRLDARMERPDQRRFQRTDPVGWVLANRGAVVTAALTLAKGYLDAKPDMGNVRPSRFPEWDRLVRFPILWASGLDVGAKFDRAHDADPTLALLHTLLQSWRDVLGEKPVTAGEIVARIGTSADFSGRDDAFKQAVIDLIADRRGLGLNAKTLGVRLATHKDRVVGGLALRSSYNRSTRTHLWFSEPVEPAGGAA